MVLCGLIKNNQDARLDCLLHVYEKTSTSTLKLNRSAGQKNRQYLHAQEDLRWLPFMALPLALIIASGLCKDGDQELDWAPGGLKQQSS